MLPIPVDWVRNMKLNKGDSLKIEMISDNRLLISPIPPQARQDSEGPESRTQLKGVSRLWKISLIILIIFPLMRLKLMQQKRKL